MCVVNIQLADDTVQLRSIANTARLLCHHLSLCITTCLVRTTIHALQWSQHNLLCIYIKKYFINILGKLYYILRINFSHGR